MVRLGAVRSTVKLSAVSGETLPAASVARAVTSTTTAEDGRVVTLGLAGRSYAATVRGGAWSVTVQAQRRIRRDVARRIRRSRRDEARALGQRGRHGEAEAAGAVGRHLNAAEHGTALVVAGTTTAEDGRVVTLGLAGRSYAGPARSGQSCRRRGCGSPARPGCRPDPIRRR
jgi:hypothetical protein